MMIRYFTPRNTETERRIYVSTVGYEEINPGEEYPTKHHPEGYYFNPACGRVLQEYQIVYFIDGTGTLELQGGERHALTAGTVLILPPGAWHSYYPDKSTGWKQYWICFKGEFVNEWMRDTSCSVGNPLFRVGINSELLGLFRKALEISGNQDNLNLIGGLINYLVNLVCNVALTQTSQHTQATDNDLKISHACELMEQAATENLRIEEIASEVGMSYPLFRKLFRQKMNMSAQQYLLRIRVQKAADMLMHTDEPVKNVAYTLGYDQPAYFSYCFHKVMGMTPKEYRDTLKK